jgi:hypothetical protein
VAFSPAPPSATPTVSCRRRAMRHAPRSCTAHASARTRTSILPSCDAAILRHLRPPPPLLQALPSTL